MVAASVAQAHRAVLVDGRKVVVKVQRPDAAIQVRIDGDIMTRFARTAQRRFQWASAMGLADLVEGFVGSLNDELDYRIEARNLELMTSVLADFERIHIPGVHQDLSTSRVLVMDEIAGTTLDTPSSKLATRAASQRADASRDLLHAVLHSIVVAGIFHADLHPGNIMMRPDGDLVLLDLGAVAILDDETRTLLATLLNAALCDDAVTATAATLMAFGVPDTMTPKP